MHFFTPDPILLDERLRTVAEMIPNGARFADIGCDHGYLSAWLLREGRVAGCQLCDISAPSLEKARRLMRSLALEKQVCFSVGDGAKALRSPVDCAVIAGMGSATIMHIISEGREQLGAARLILQPNVDAPELRAFLMQNGYRIADERIARAGGRHYVILAAEPGEASYTPEELLCGPVLLQRGGEAFASFADFRIRVAQKALRGAAEAGGERAGELAREIETWQRAKERARL
ncbi:MAG: class I SAM-dependent methyltransferase [Eubacteriales bacterium]|nr:class I SAM-dependent methyltransferase [Eubacteriales bacterium]